MDLECHDCGGKSSGPRIWVGNRRDSDPPRIIFGRGKLNSHSTVKLKSYEGSLPLPLGEWFKLTVEVTLGVNEAGRSRVWINEQLDIDEIGTNIKPDGYQGLDHYNFLQFGITGNATGEEPNGQYTAFTMYVDDVLIEHKK